MSFQNEIVYASTPNPEAWNELQPDICYARLFRNDWGDGLKRGNKYVLTAFRLDDDITTVRANWWVKNILAVCPPELSGGFTVSRIQPHVLDLVHGNFRRGRGWVEVVLRGDVLSANEIYLMLSLLRYPQEQAEVVNRTKLIMLKYGLPFDQSFLFAGSGDSHSGHGMICTNTWVDMKNQTVEDARRIITEYSLKKVVQRVVDTRVEKGTFTKSTVKDTINKFFTPPALKYHGWGEGHVGCNAYDQHGNRVVEPDIGLIPNYWLKKFGYERKEKK